MSGIMEDILAELQGIRAALEGGSTGKPASGGSSKPASSKKKTVSATEITEKMQPLTHDDGQKEKVKKLLASFGVKRFGELSEDQYQGFYDALVKIEAEGASDDDDDDLLA